MVPDRGDQIPQSRVYELREVFNKFDRNRSETITSADLADALRCAGQNPSESEISRLVEVVDSEAGGKLEFKDFLMIISRVMQESRTEQDLRDAFRVFDPTGHGTVNATEMRYFLTQFADKLSDDQMNAFVTESDADQDGNIIYEDFIKKMLGKA